MSFQILHSSIINPQAWNKTILAQGSDVYNEFYYLEATTNKNWLGIIWGDYEKVLPFYQKKKLGLIPYVCMPPYVQKFDTIFLTKSEFEQVISFLKSKNFIVDFRVNDTKEIQGFQSKRNFILDKSKQSFSQLESNFPSLLRKNILKAAQYLDIDDKAPISSITSFLKSNDLFNQLNINSPWILDFPYGRTLTARYKGTHEIVAVLFYILYNNKAYIIAPYSSVKGKNTQAMTGLILNLIKDKSIQIIDFEGSSIDSIANFYAQFGAVEEDYFSMEWRKI